MSSEKLRKYLAYYQRVLKAEPENIEARLRLAAIFREMGKESHAVEEYVAASKLLAKEGLPLEAIAACKAVLELQPGHTEIQYFLARLFAQVPDAMGKSARVARPVDPLAARQTPMRPEAAVAPTAADEVQDDAFVLRDPKSRETTRRADVVDEVWAHEKPTQAGGSPEPDGLGAEPTSPLDEEVHRMSLRADELTTPLEFVPSFSPHTPDSVTREYGTRVPEPPELPEAYNATTRPIRPLVPGQELGKGISFETFEVNVFDMESLELDEESEIDFTFLEEFEGEVGEFLAAEVSATRPAVFSVSRGDLPEIALFSKLPPDVFMRLLAVMDLQRVPAGTTILMPDHSSRTLFIVVHGKALVTRMVDGVEVELATMDEGEFFGEFVLLTGRTGLATVRAQTDCELLAIHENVVNDIADEYPEIWDVLWDFYYVRMLNNLLASSEIFRPLDVRARNRLARQFEMQEIVAGEVFLREGEPCKHLHLILSGEVDVQRSISGMVQHLVTLREGEFFGLASSLNDEPYLADLRATRDTVILRLPSEEFRALTDANQAIDSAVQLAIMSRRELNSAFLSGITAYAELGVAKVDS